MKIEQAPILSTKSAGAFYGIQQSQIPNITPTAQNNISTAKLGTGIGAGIQVVSGIFSALNGFNSATGLSGSIDTLVNSTNMQLNQINAALNQGKMASARKTNLLMQQQQQDIIKSNIDPSSDVAFKVFNQDYINKLNEDFTSEVNGTISKLNTLYQAEQQASQIVSTQQQQMFSGITNLIGAGIGAATLIAAL